METGPLTLLEAFAVDSLSAGTDLGGIKELINQKGCFILPPKSSAWKDLLIRILQNKNYLEEFISPSKII